LEILMLTSPFLQITLWKRLEVDEQKWGVYAGSSKRYNAQKNVWQTCSNCYTEAEAAEKAFLIRKKHGILALKMLEISVSTSRKFILDAMAFN
jgi:hypothetical protein